MVPGESMVLVKVYRAGTLARLGHNHVIATRELSGTLDLAPLAADSRLQLSFDKTSLTVDEPGLRAGAGEQFATEVPPDAVAGTRENMLGPRLLDSVNYPTVQLRSSHIDGSLPELDVTARVQIRAEEYEVSFPTRVRITGHRLTADGSRHLTHAQLGLEPFSVMLGALRVQDEMELQYSIVAERVD